MRLRIYLVALFFALGVACLSTPAQAQVPDPYTLYLCVASISGKSTPPANCTPAFAYWHTPSRAGLAIYSRNPPKFLLTPLTTTASNP